MTERKWREEVVSILDRYPEVIPTVHEVLKEGLRLDHDGGGTPENVKQLQSFAEMLLEELKEQEQEEGHCKT